MKQIKTAVLIFVIFTVFLGVVYPLVITGISQLTFPTQANGDIIKINGTVLGSELIGQDFNSSKYFQGRPSFIDYNSSTSGGTNWGPTNQKLIGNVSERIGQLKSENNLPINSTVPADLVLSSASGLEGYIYVDSAMIQVPRIASVRGISESEVKQLIENKKENTFFGFGQEIVNVLKLNIALDDLKK